MAFKEVTNESKATVTKSGDNMDLHPSRISLLFKFVMPHRNFGTSRIENEYIKLLVVRDTIGA